MVPEEEPQLAVLGILMRALRSIPELQQGLVVTVLLAMVAAGGRVSIPLLLRRAIDDGFNARGGIDIGVITKLSVIGFAIAQVTTMAGTLSRYRLTVQAEKALAALRRNVIDRLLKMSIGQHGSQRRGVLVARVTSDVETLSQFFSWGALSWVLSVTVMIVVGLSMLLVEWKLAVLTFVISAPILLVAGQMRKRLVPLHMQVREQIGAYLGGVSELVAAAPLIRAYGAQETVGGVVHSALRLRQKTSRRADRTSALLFISAEGFMVLTIAGILALSLAWRTGHGLTAGTVVGFVFLARAFLEPVMDLAEVQDQTNRAAAGLARVLDLVDMPIDVAEPAHPVALPSGPLAVSLNQVTYEYPPRDDEPVTSEVFALRDISLQIESGETIAFVGATGSGKSTLAKLIVRSADPTGGVVSIGGVSLTDVAWADLRNRVQLVPQEPFLFDDSIATNISLAGSNMSTCDVEELLGQVGLGNWIEGLTLGSQTQVGERGGLISAGERQLVALARARAGNPDVLVLDEATSSVDAATEAQLAETLDSLSKGRTTIVIAHRLTTVARADRVVVMEAGRIVEVGTPAELAAIPGGHYAGLVEAWERAVG